MWQEDEDEDVRSDWMTLRTGEDTLIWKRRLWIALCGGIVLEEALDLSSDRLLNIIISHGWHGVPQWPVPLPQHQYKNYSSYFKTYFSGQTGHLALTVSPARKNCKLPAVYLYCYCASAQLNHSHFSVAISSAHKELAATADVKRRKAMKLFRLLALWSNLATPSELLATLY